mmetsp:Transcript_34257/g.51658  ORF Transcript_34257/g.51658 Transcript_34257/m.51658 type:complete len:224 (-) Transcript_34257:111-782(-)
MGMLFRAGADPKSLDCTLPFGRTCCKGCLFRLRTWISLGPPASGCGVKLPPPKPSLPRETTYVAKKTLPPCSECSDLPTTELLGRSKRWRKPRRAWEEDQKCSDAVSLLWTARIGPHGGISCSPLLNSTWPTIQQAPMVPQRSLHLEGKGTRSGRRNASIRRRACRALELVRPPSRQSVPIAFSWSVGTRAEPPECRKTPGPPRWPRVPEMRRVPKPSLLCFV